MTPWVARPTPGTSRARARTTPTTGSGGSPPPWRTTSMAPPPASTATTTSRTPSRTTPWASSRATARPPRCSPRPAIRRSRPPQAWHYGYDPAGHLAVQTPPVNTTAITQLASTGWEYDAGGRLATSCDTTAPGSTCAAGGAAEPPSNPARFTTAPERLGTATVKLRGRCPARSARPQPNPARGARSLPWTRPRATGPPHRQPRG